MTFSDRDYKRAFAQYVRRGTPIEETLKALSPGSMLDTKAEDHPTKYYIWHIQEDDKVRPCHKANDGKVSLGSIRRTRALFTQTFSAAPRPSNAFM